MLVNYMLIILLCGCYRKTFVPSIISAVDSSTTNQESRSDEAKNGVVTAVGIVDTEKISTPKNDENHAQNTDGVDIVDIVDTVGVSGGMKSTDPSVARTSQYLKNLQEAEKIRNEGKEA
jgi:hypothetical protein